MTETFTIPVPLLYDVSPILGSLTYHGTAA